MEVHSGKTLSVLRNHVGTPRRAVLMRHRTSRGPRQPLHARPAHVRSLQGSDGVDGPTVPVLQGRRLSSLTTQNGQKESGGRRQSRGVTGRRPLPLRGARGRPPPADRDDAHSGPAPEARQSEQPLEDQTHPIVESSEPPLGAPGDLGARPAHHPHPLQGFPPPPPRTGGHPPAAPHPPGRPCRPCRPLHPRPRAPPGSPPPPTRRGTAPPSGR